MTKQVNKNGIHNRRKTSKREEGILEILKIEFLDMEVAVLIDIAGFY